MGERLVISIERRGKRYATAYYHWSGYTTCALHTIKDAVKYLKSVNIEKLGCVNNPSYEQCAVEALLKTGAGLCHDRATESFCKEENIPYTDETKAVSRNHGLIDLTDEGISNSTMWAEEYARIELMTKSVDCQQVFWLYENLKQYNEEYDRNFKDDDFYFYECEYNIASLDLSKFEEFLEEVESEKAKAEEKGKKFVIKWNGKLLDFIE